MSPELHTYDRFIIASSGGKDSTACKLYLRELGILPSQIEVWHHDVDGNQSGDNIMDWPCTQSYTRALSKHLGLEFYLSWKHGGFKGELLRNSQSTAPTSFETPDGQIITRGGNGEAGTRLKFPAVSGDMTKRWCSPYLKIDVSRIALRNQERFCNSRTLFISGERAQESPKREKYNPFTIHAADARKGRLKRHIDHWMPIHTWKKEQVWEIIQRHQINPHPAYKLGWGRASCAGCIFASNDQCASHRKVNPFQFYVLNGLEIALNHTIVHGSDMTQRAAKGKPYAAITPERIKEALDPDWALNYPITLSPWVQPAGAYGEDTGPN